MARDEDLPVTSIIESAARALGVADDPVKVKALGEAVLRGYMAGVRAGESEVLSQAAEQGVDFAQAQLGGPNAPPA